MLYSHFIVFVFFCGISQQVKGQDLSRCNFPCLWQQVGNISAATISYSDFVNQNEDATISDALRIVFPEDRPSEMHFITKRTGVLNVVFCYEIFDQFIMARFFQPGTDIISYYCLQVVEIQGDNFMVQLSLQSSTDPDRCNACSNPAAMLFLTEEINQTNVTISDFVPLNCTKSRGCPDCEGCDICTDEESSTIDIECPTSPTTQPPCSGESSEGSSGESYSSEE